MKGGKGSEKEVSDSGYGLFVKLLSSRSEMARSYESLLSSIHLLSSNQSLKTVLVTSCQPQEGKTTVSCSLALAMTLTGKKVIVLDADLRRPRQHKIFQLDNAVGLVDVLTGSQGIQRVIQVVPLLADGRESTLTLSVITSGRVVPNFFNPKASMELKEGIEYLKNVYDFVLLDSPPILSVNDGLFLAPLVDGVILVVSSGVVTEKEAKSVKERLEQAGANILGVVMNRFDEKFHGPGSHPYSYYYYLDGK